MDELELKKKSLDELLKMEVVRVVIKVELNMELLISLSKVVEEVALHNMELFGRASTG